MTWKLFSRQLGVTNNMHYSWGVPVVQESQSSMTV